MSTTPSESQLTQALHECRNGDHEAFERVIALLYNDLRQVARRQLGRLRFGATLDTTVLVHEAYLKLNDSYRIESTDRAHFLAILGCAMRQIIVDYARRRHALKRGGDLARVTFDESEIGVSRDVDQLIALDDALARLGELDPRLVRIVECRFYAGMTEEETADALERAPDERDAFIDSACGDDKELASEVRNLLGGGLEDDGFLSPGGALSGAVWEEMTGAREHRPHPESIGPYRVLDQIGRGGMGVVYLATRGTNDGDDRVALKLLHEAGWSRGSMLRFEQERSILSSLDHSGIARYLDSGVTDEGRPYLATTTSTWPGHGACSQPSISTANGPTRRPCCSIRRFRCSRRPSALTTPRSRPPWIGAAGPRPGEVGRSLDTMRSTPEREG